MNEKFEPNYCCYNMANSNPQSHSAFFMGFYSLALEGNRFPLLEKTEVTASFFLLFQTKKYYLYSD